jgi:16S rRNA G966 N2-methylase RsmD
VLAQNCAHIDINETGKTAAKLAKRAGVSTRTYEMGKQILKNRHSEIELQKLRTGALKISNVYNYDQKQKKRAVLRAEATTTLPTGVNLMLGDFREKCKDIPDNSIDLVFTDPPYTKECISLYKDLAEIAFRKLKEGGSLVTYIEQLSLREIYDYIESSGMRYNWILAVKHTGGSTAQNGQHVFVTWKPLLWFVKGSKLRTPDYIRDSVESQPPDKSLQDWAQSPVEAEHVISKLTVQGDTVLDCFMGSGTTGIAALHLKRKFIGIEKDENRFNVARGNIAKEVERLKNNGMTTAGSTVPK